MEISVQVKMPRFFVEEVIDTQVFLSETGPYRIIKHSKRVPLNHNELKEEAYLLLLSCAFLDPR